MTGMHVLSTKLMPVHLPNNANIQKYGHCNKTTRHDFNKTDIRKSLWK